jgi:hypothetical protein
LDSYRSIAIYVALTNAPLLHLIFQLGPVPIANFNFDAFKFSLLVIDENMVMYQITCDLCFPFVFYGIDSRDCGLTSNIDFIHLSGRHSNVSISGSIPLPSFLQRKIPLDPSCAVSKIIEETAKVGGILEIVTSVSMSTEIHYVQFPIVAHPSLLAPVIFVGGSLPPYVIRLSISSSYRLSTSDCLN